MKLLESNGILQTAFSGIISNYLFAPEMVGYVPGVLNNCNIVKTSNSSITMGEGLIIINGVRILVDEPYVITIPNYPATNTVYHLYLRITITENGENSVVANYRIKQELRQDDFLLTNNGIYEIELASFIMGSSGIQSFIKELKAVELPIFKTLTEQEYNAISTKDENTYYFIVEK